MRQFTFVLSAGILLSACSMGGSENFLATVGKPTDQRIAQSGEEIASIFNERGDKMSVYIFVGMTNDRKVIVHKKSGDRSFWGKSKDKTQKITLSLHQSLRFANGSRIVFLDVEPSKLTYRRISL